MLQTIRVLDLSHLSRHCSSVHIVSPTLPSISISLYDQNVLLRRVDHAVTQEGRFGAVFKILTI